MIRKKLDSANVFVVLREGVSGPTCCEVWLGGFRIQIAGAVGSRRGTYVSGVNILAEAMKKVASREPAYKKGMTLILGKRSYSSLGTEGVEPDDDLVWHGTVKLTRTLFGDIAVKITDERQDPKRHYDYSVCPKNLMGVIAILSKSPT